MKFHKILSIGLALASSAFVAVAADAYKVDPAHSTVGFAVSHMVINNVHGKFTEYTGSLMVEGGKITEANGTIQAKTINTEVEARDKDLRSASFFDVEKYPTITFKSKRAEQKDAETILVGDFTMHGVTKEIALPVTLKGPIKDPWGKQRVGLQAKIKVNRKDYGLSYNKVLETGGLMVGDMVEIEINAEAVKASPAS
jgi:polyisoprenoid-binding protein YceI